MRRDAAELARAFLAVPPDARGAAPAWDEVMDRIEDRANTDDAWVLVRALLDNAPDDELGLMAAGPLEDFVRVHALSAITQIEEMARRDARFRWALGAIWLSAGSLPEPLMARLIKASGDKIKPLQAAAPS